jgi:hypothetical protein
MNVARNTKAMPTNVVALRPRLALRSAETGATLWQRFRGRLIGALGAALNRLAMPGAIRNAEIEDELTGQKLSVQVSPYFVRITVDGRDYYFNRFTGKFDGTGSSPD